MGVDSPPYGRVTSGMISTLGDPVRLDSPARLRGAVNGEVVMTAAAAAVMDHPAASVAWLANQLAETGERLRAGQLVFSRGVTSPMPVVRGSSVTFEFDGLGGIEVYGA